MIGREEKQTIRLGFSFIDSGYGGVIGWNNVAIYLNLCRFIWRSTNNDYDDYFKNGVLVARVSLRKLAAITGMSAATVKNCLTRLEDAKWIETLHENSKTLVYLIGYQNEPADVENSWTIILAEREYCKFIGKYVEYDDRINKNWDVDYLNN